MPALIAFAPYLGTTLLLAGAGAAAAGAMGAFGGGEKPPEAPAAPEIPAAAAAPTPGDANAAAKAEMERIRKMRALSGGQTLLTKEAPMLASGTGKTLLGS